MTSIWRTSGWILLGSALILALSLGTRHGFGLFLAPMSADFGWGREVFAFAIALQNLMWGLAQHLPARWRTALARQKSSSSAASSMPWGCCA
ncbi:hypothetical protein PSA5_26515 [Pseudomonas syringae pv. actinidiae]|nr:hypothetical protein PSA5_26515 [Pseudomonas syringae pv. actinidiae]